MKRLQGIKKLKFIQWQQNKSNKKTSKKRPPPNLLSIPYDLSDHTKFDDFIKKLTVNENRNHIKITKKFQGHPDKLILLRERLEPFQNVIKKYIFSKKEHAKLFRDLKIGMPEQMPADTINLYTSRIENNNARQNFMGHKTINKDTKNIRPKDMHDFIDRVAELDKPLKNKHSILQDERKKQLIANSFKEAIYNIQGHAYLETDIEKRIEIHANFDSEYQHIWIMAIDKGITIPISIKEKAHEGHPRWKKIMNLGADIADKELIEIATQENMTSRSEEGKGQGLFSMKEHTDILNKELSNRASLVIYSGEGAYFYPEERTEKLPIRYDGTIIYWQFGYQNND